MEGPAAHRPVLVRDVVALLEPQSRKLFVDCTVGLGGHAEALLAAACEQAQLVGIDVDESNLLAARDRLQRFAPRFRLFRANFADLPDVLAAAGVSSADALLADLGVASSQLDDPSRGLSFAADGPLDMRLDRSAGRTAADLVNDLDEAALAELIYRYGEERYSRRIARAIVQRRRRGRIERTTDLAAVVAAAYPAPARRSRRGVHPATRTFQALRIAVNEELDRLDALLAAMPTVLSGGGRAAIISFHSLEDRRVKQAFAALAKAGRAKLLTKKPITPSDDETSENPRSRSAKLRGLEMEHAA
ncbi:MAG: 16S rRNA (cytosine(1402)-N(4))-methyltransferase RsmH [Phycisphaerae bacterium]|nr:16S rRNA (cytosine(1402)-N(4))-methyltransferase RsmH [Phycisphaerae bacterium]